MKRSDKCVAVNATALVILSNLLVFGLFGCSGKHSGAERGSVTGKVTLDNKPILSGSITFFPAGKAEGAVVGGEIKDGNYFIGADSGPIVGTNRIEIHWPLKTGKTLGLPPDDGLGARDLPPQEELVEAIPAKYNARSELIYEVESGKNNIDFLLETD